MEQPTANSIRLVVERRGLRPFTPNSDYKCDANYPKLLEFVRTASHAELKEMLITCRLKKYCWRSTWKTPQKTLYSILMTDTTTQLGQDAVNRIQFVVDLCCHNQNFSCWFVLSVLEKEMVRRFMTAF